MLRKLSGLHTQRRIVTKTREGFADVVRARGMCRSESFGWSWEAAMRPCTGPDREAVRTLDNVEQMSSS
ncbi:hypothetical protein HBI23_154910 [Parastagonospora nodorum]|nr:hypothetical protein HBI12_153250 [Parastagonospora nodorum]KAH5418539.1 hypothetical protein HBI47_142850 [Parastagonospora nodorum]KAH5654517.1 hypothetical protein HBI23_154910 [Parastagonospora nodorum]KAH6057812.1 hypothetical protein HBI67_183210 [Parastagonospora nodorum]KAH6066865.1 hypothetical protein HBI66_152580 [Parastagonospora nodorum]